jgi:hypothetical protein
LNSGKKRLQFKVKPIFSQEIVLRSIKDRPGRGTLSYIRFLRIPAGMSDGMPRRSVSFNPLSTSLPACSTASRDFLCIVAAAVLSGPTVSSRSCGRSTARDFRFLEDEGCRCAMFSSLPVFPPAQKLRPDPVRGVQRNAGKFFRFGVDQGLATLNTCFLAALLREKKARGQGRAGWAERSATHHLPDSAGMRCISLYHGAWFTDVTTRNASCRNPCRFPRQSSMDPFFPHAAID